MQMQGQAQPPGGAKPPPFGSSPATQPTPNRGAEAAAMQKLAMGVKLIGDAMAQAGAASELGQNIMKHLQGLAKLVPVGGSTPTSDKNTLEQAQLKNAQQNQMMQQMQAQRAQAAAKPPQMAQAA